MKKFVLPILIASALLATTALSPVSAANNSVHKGTKLTTAEVSNFLQSLPQSYYLENPEFSKTVEEFYKLIKEENDMQAIEKRLMQTSAYKALAQKHAYDKNVADEPSKAYNEQLHRIDKLAIEYYQHLQKYGKLPAEATVPSLTAGEAVPILSGVGLYYSEATVAARLAQLGTIMSLGGALPAVTFIALVTGVIVLGYYVGTLEWKQSEVVADVRSHEGDTYAEKAAATISSSIVVRNNLRNGLKHFIAWRNNGPGGGVLVGTYISLPSAISRLSSGADTFSATQADAFAVADGASTGSAPVWDAAHNLSSQPNNLPHYHATVLFVRKDGHAFHP